ncbi:MAG TPA: hypothetical protein VIY54_06695 [Steroidobacteraceae bacterium]
MGRTTGQLSRPLYEGLPWVYMACGLAALAGSYVRLSHTMSVVVAGAGFLSILWGVVVLMRRREYRRLRSEYDNDDASLNDLDVK